MYSNYRSMACDSPASDYRSNTSPLSETTVSKKFSFLIGVQLWFELEYKFSNGYFSNRIPRFKKNYFIMKKLTDLHKLKVLLFIFLVQTMEDCVF